MRELIYLSEQKLQQFISDKPPSWLRRARLEADITVPGIGNVKAGLAEPAQEKRTGSDLNKAIAALESSSRAAGWFADEKAQPGQWVYFEAPLSYTTIGESVIFLDAGRDTGSDRTGQIVRLMLHGSLVHLNSSTSVRDKITPARGRSAFHGMMRDLNRYLAAEEAKLNASAAPPGQDDPLPSRLDWAIASLSRALHPDYTAAWMGGCARITAVLPSVSGARLVIASPLYVEFIGEQAYPE